MPKIAWNQPGERVYETGVDRGVLYPKNSDGVPWNGLISVSQGSDGGEVTPLYHDGIKIGNFMVSEEYTGTIESYAAPREFGSCDGSPELVPGLFAGQQNRTSFGLCYRTLKGNDLDGMEHGYKLHLIYGCLALPSGATYATNSDQPKPVTRSWSFKTVPPRTPYYKPTAYFEIDSTLVSPVKLEILENALYGTTSSPPQLPTQVQVIFTIG